MPAPLYLTVWFPTFTASDMFPRAISILKEFPYSKTRAGVAAVAVQPVSWSEASILERRFRPGLDPEQAVAMASDLLHTDYAYIFEVYWDLWTQSEETNQWSLAPSLVRIIVNGTDFDEGSYKQSGHIQVDFGLDTPFLFEDIELTPVEEARVRVNVHKLVQFTSSVERNCGITGRVLWSESEENLAEKLIARLQKVQ